MFHAYPEDARQMILYLDNKPNISDFYYVRNVAGWDLERGRISKEQVKKSLSSTPFSICAYDAGSVVGMVRMSGDKGMYGYIQDLIVVPAQRNQKIATDLLLRLLGKVAGLEGYLIGACPSKIAVSLYLRFGFVPRGIGDNPFMYFQVKGDNLTLLLSRMVKGSCPGV